MVQPTAQDAEARRGGHAGRPRLQNALEYGAAPPKRVDSRARIRLRHPAALVYAAREAIKHNRSPPSAGRRVFDLSGGVLHCIACGRRMGGTNVLDPKTRRGYFYYVRSKCVAPTGATRRSGASGPTS